MEWKFVEFGPGQKYPLKNDDGEHTYSTDHHDFEDAGLVLPEDIVVVDIDKLEKDQCQALLELLQPRGMYVETNRGLHFYFKKPKGPTKSEFNCFLGFPIEVKKNIITIKQNGRLRDIYNKDRIEDFPWFFHETKDLDPTLGLGEGNRHNTLTKYKFAMMNHPECNDILYFMNEWLLEEPQEAKQFQGILNIQAGEMAEKGDRIAWVINETDPVLWNGELYLKVNGEYTNDYFLHRRKIDELMPNLMTHEWEEVLKKVQVRADYIRGHKKFKIKFKNGFLYNGNFIYGNTNEFTPYYFPWEYKPDAPRPEAWDIFIKAINTSGDEHFEDYIHQMFGAAFEVDPYIRAAHPRVHFIIGDGGNGKGTICKAYGRLFSQETMSTVKIHQLDDKNNIIALGSTLLNLGEDIEEKPLDTKVMEAVKSISAADKITVRGLYEKAKNQRVIMPALIFTSNHVIGTFEKGQSWQRRAFWVKMDNNIGELPQFVFDGLKTDECGEYLIRRMIEGYLLYRASGWVDCRVVHEFSAAYHSDNDPFTDFCNNHKIEDFEYKTMREAYIIYESYCEDIGVNVGTIGAFGKKLKVAYNMHNDKAYKVGGRTCRPLLIKTKTYASEDVKEGMI